MSAEDEIKRLREEVEQLKRALGNKQQLPAPSLLALIDNDEFCLSMAKYSEGLQGYSEQDVRRRWKFTDAEWTALGADDRLVERIQEFKLARVKTGAARRELAQNHIVRGPQILNDIATNPRSNDRHKIDAIRALDGLADPGPQRATADEVHVVINLGGDVLRFGGSIKPTFDTGKIIDSTPSPVPGFVIEATKKDDGGGNAL